jgi:hypothetical protein
MVNSAFTGNQANSGLGGAVYMSMSGVVDIWNCTFKDNTGGNPSNVSSAIHVVSGNPTIRSTIVDEFASGLNGCSSAAPASPIVSGGYNIDSGNSCNFVAAGDKVFTNPKVDGLAWNPGPSAKTPTLALLAGSPAIDVVPVYNAPKIDQRGVPRPQFYCSVTCYYASFSTLSDVGAYEAPPQPPPSGLPRLRLF